jgi:hypothetical protein
MSPNLVAIANKTAAEAKVVVSASIGCAIVGNPSTAWALINTIQLISYYPMNTNPLTPGLLAFFNNLGGYNILPNSMTYIFDMNSASPPYAEASNYGFISSVFFINIGSFVTSFLAITIFWPVAYILTKIKIGILAGETIKILGNYRYSFFLRFWTQSYLDLGFAAIIQLKAVT